MTTLSGSKVIIVIELTSLAQLQGSTSTLLGTIQKLNLSMLIIVMMYSARRSYKLMLKSQ
jgi:hypothetical protein